MSNTPLRIATRASRLALWQAHHVADLLRNSHPGCEVEIVHVSTIGDRDKTESLESLGGTGVFTREVQKAMLDNRADIAVHSLKDLPTEPVDGLTLAAVPQRASMFDVLVLPELKGEESHIEQTSALDLLPKLARVGTGSLRRQAQLLHLRDDLRMSEVRGNVETRLKKLDDGDYDALILAEAGLRRLGLAARVNVVLGPPILLPAVGQGALGIECRADDKEICDTLEKIDDLFTHQAVAAERRLLLQMRAGCHAPLGVFTTRTDEQMTLEAVVLSRDGRQRLFASATAQAEEPDSLGIKVAENLLEQGAAKLVDDAKQIP